MKLKPEQLSQHLAGNLLPVYLVSGEESLLVNEAVNEIRQAAKTGGYLERETLQVDRSFHWDELLQSASSMSLFSSKKLIELRIGAGKLGTNGSKALLDYLSRLSPDLVLLVVGDKLESQVTSSKWHKEVEKVGVTIQTWPISPRELPGWIRGRMTRLNLQPIGQSVNLLAELVEGNLQAADQEIKKLSLLYEAGGSIDEAQIIAAVSDSSRFKLFDLSDAFLEGNAKQVVRVLQGLNEEGIEPILVLWLVNRELRNLVQFSQSAKGVESAPPYMPQRQKAALGAALGRRNPQQWQRMLGQTALLDRCIKGVAPGNPWQLLQHICLNIAGVALPTSDLTTMS